MHIEGELLEAHFVRRINRFLAVVQLHEMENFVHVPNTGRLSELLVEGAKVCLKKFDDPNRKTQYGLLFVAYKGIWVSVDASNMPNRLMEEALEKGLLSEFEGLSLLRREVLVHDSRFDFSFQWKNNLYFMEIKGVNLVEDGVAMFPDAPTKRGEKHLRELILQKKKGCGACVVFLIQREDATVFRPHMVRDPAFSRALLDAFVAGVELYAYVSKIDLKKRAMEIVSPVPISLE
jgi:sugar fermentation stimulation protein A